ncbi:MAG TPA: PVC-type heme-binding CxxCH protein [Pirellulales bacterium]|nr:PVC-type heme-binding CxxCH protein [Pirellulales bacterium]
MGAWLASSSAISNLAFAAEPATSAERQSPLPPLEEAKQMRVPEGFHVSLFAGEPDLAQPIAFTTDDRGRVWVAECFSYPVWKPEGNDCVLCFSDPHDAGHFDGRTVVWDKANNLTGVELGFGGMWVCCAPKILFVPLDKEGTKLAGPPQTMLDGWSLKGIHNIVNCLMWGPDGWLYGCNGNSAPSRVGTADTPVAERTPMSSGVWRYHPTKHIFEVVARGMVNPWGLDYDDYGQMFATNCVLAHLWHIIPGAHFPRTRDAGEDPYAYEFIQATSDHLHWGGGDWTTSRGGKGIHSEAGGGHAHAGAMVYLADNWPEKYRGSIFMCNIHGNRVNNDLLERRGSGYVGRHGKDFLLSGDTWFRGLNLKYGPDGAVYLSDWCDSGECHNFAKTDRSNGRIYKIAYGAPAAPPVDLDLSKLSDAELVRMQTSSNDWYVRHARRILQERFAAGRDMSQVHKALTTMFTVETSVPHILRALWGLHVTGGDSQAFLLGQLHHESEYIRGWAVQFLLEDKNPSAAVQQELAQLAEIEPSPFVRLNLASGLQRMPLGERWSIAGSLASHAEDADDHNLPLMLWYGVEPAAAADPAAGLAFAAKCKLSKVRRFVARRIGDAPLIVKTLATICGKQSPDPAAEFDLLAGLHDALRGRRHEPLPAGWAEVYAKLLQSPAANVRAEADVLALVFGDAAAADALRRVAADPTADIERRQEALAALVEVRAPNMAGILQKLVDESAMRVHALQGLAAYDDPQTAQVILRIYPRLDAAEKHDAIETLASRPAYAIALLDAVEQHEIPAADISVFTARQLREFKDRKISDKLAKVWGNVRESSADKKEQLDHYKSMLTPEFLKHADVSHGRLLFSHTCMQCHTLYGIGGKIGPDLTGSNRDHVDYVLQQVIDPSAAVPKEYQMQMILLKDGRLLNGIIRERTARSIVVQTDTQRIALATEDIDQIKPSKMSMMPERQFDKLKPEEIRDLLGYLATHSQVPLPPGAQ